MSVAPLKNPRELPGPLTSDVVQQYGVVPWRRNKRGHMRVLLVTTPGRGGWTVPVGDPAGDRAPYLSAAMEAFQTAGVIGDIRSTPLYTYHRAAEENGDGSHRHHVTLFGLRVRGTLTNWPDRNRWTRKWFDLDDAANVAAEAGLAVAFRTIGNAPERLSAMGRAAPGAASDSGLSATI